MAKKKNKSRSKNFWIVVLIGVIVIFIAIIFWNQRQVNTFQKYTSIVLPTLMPTSSLAQYYSEYLKIHFSVSAGFYIRELHNDITLKNDVGEILILRNGTNDDTIEGYLFDISDRAKIQIINKQKMKINGLDVISCITRSSVRDEPDSRDYYFYTSPGEVFVITTSSPELFGELDQIARSFRYEP